MMWGFANGKIKAARRDGCGRACRDARLEGAAAKSIRKATEAKAILKILTMVSGCVAHPARVHGRDARATFSLLNRLKLLFTQDFNQSTCVAARNICVVWHAQNAHRSLTPALADGYFVPDFDGMSGLCATAIEQNKARVTKLLG